MKFNSSDRDTITAEVERADIDSYSFDLNKSLHLVRRLKEQTPEVEDQVLRFLSAAVRSSVSRSFDKFSLGVHNWLMLCYFTSNYDFDLYLIFR